LKTLSFVSSNRRYDLSTDAATLFEPASSLPLPESCEARKGGIQGIAGAVRVNPTRLRKAPKVTVPEDVDVVLYYPSLNVLVSARVAEALQKLGFSDVWVLEGGLKTRIEEGAPFTPELSTPEMVAARLRIILPPAAS
jgi:rhodanese-related sulfurtransferase